MNRYNSRNDFGRDDSAINIVVVIIIIIFFTQVLNSSQGMKKLRYAAMQYKKVQKSSWNEPYSSSFEKQSCSKMASYC